MSRFELTVIVVVALLAVFAFLPVKRVPVSYNYRNLVVRWITTLLTGFGFMVVVGLLVVLLAFVQGLKELAKKTGPEGNVIILRDGANDELFSEIAIDANESELWNQPEVLRVDPSDPKSEKLASQEVYSIATQELPPKDDTGRPDYRFLQIRGVEDCAMAGRVHGLGVKEGRWFTRGGSECVMGDGIARTLGLKLNDEFYPRERPDQEAKTPPAPSSADEP